jgi:hypothetical protein
VNIWLLDAKNSKILNKINAKQLKVFAGKGFELSDDRELRTKHVQFMDKDSKVIKNIYF